MFDTKERVREVERVVFLRVIDSRWTNHIDDMDVLVKKTLWLNINCSL